MATRTQSERESDEDVCECDFDMYESDDDHILESDDGGVFDESESDDDMSHSDSESDDDSDEDLDGFELDALDIKLTRERGGVRINTIATWKRDHDDEYYEVIEEKDELFVEILEDEAMVGNDGFVEEKKSDQPSAFSQPSSSSSSSSASSSSSSGNGMRFFSGTNPNGTASYSVQFGSFGGNNGNPFGGNGNPSGGNNGNPRWKGEAVNPNGASYSVQLGSFGGNNGNPSGGNIRSQQMGGGAGSLFNSLFQQLGAMQQNQQQQQQQQQQSSSSSSSSSQASSAPSQQQQPQQQPAQPQLPPFFQSFMMPPQPQGGAGSGVGAGGGQQQPPIMNFQQLLGNLGDMFGSMGGGPGAQRQGGQGGGEVCKLLGNLGDMFGSMGGGPGAQRQGQMGPGGMGIEQMLSQMIGAPISGNLGDYGLGRSLSDIMATLVDPNRHGPPPATEEAIDALRNVTITEAHVASDSPDCAVCQDSFKVGESAKELPCEHMFHPDCVLPWLKEHCTCPVCRHELPTNNQFFEQQRAARNAANRSGGAAASANGASANAASATNTDGSSGGANPSPSSS